MSLKNIINYIETEGVENDLQGRRNIIKSFASKAALASLPFVGANLYSKKANAQSKRSIIIALNVLLKSHTLVQEIYKKGALIATIPDNFKPLFQKLTSNNDKQIEVLNNLITDLGGTADTIDLADVDLSGNYQLTPGPFIDSFNTHKEFIPFIMFFADFNSRIYKGVITEVLSDKPTLRALLNIHSVKAREAVAIRDWYKLWFGVNIEPWITKAESNNPVIAAQVAYDGEAAVVQNGISIVGINGYNIPEKAATEAFDEVINMPNALETLDKFFKRKTSKQL